jgi:transglutaminase-like putative cysteine protease
VSAATARPRTTGAVHLSLGVALVALWASGLPAALPTALAAAALAWAAWRNRRGAGPGPHADRLATIAAFAYLPLFAADLLLLSHNLLHASLRLLIFLSIVRVLVARSDRERLQLLLLGFLAAVVATASTTQMGFALPLAIYTGTALWALACRQADLAGARRRPSIRRTAVHAGAALGLGLAAFFLIPHVGTGYFRPGGRLRQEVSGFSGRIELGSINRIKRNHEIVMRVRLLGDPPAGVPLRWRGRTFDAFDGRAWARTRDDVRWLFDPQGSFDLDRPGAPALLEYSVALEPIESRALFAAAEPVRMQMDGVRRVGAEPGDGYQISFLPRSRLQYRVASRLQGSLRLRDEPAGAGRDYPPSVPETYLQLPPLDPGIPALAARMVGAETDPYRMAEAVESALRAGYAYTLDVQDAGVRDPLTRFLLERAPGHCEYFATAMAILLRSRGVPARVVTGFLEGEFSDLHGTILVRQSDAHSWVEVYFPRHGWVEFDPTPPLPVDTDASLLARLRRGYERLEVAWDTWVIGLDLNDQAAILGRLRDAATAAASALAASVVAPLRRGGWLPLAGLGAGLLASAAALLWLVRRLPGAARRWRRLGLRGHGSSPRADPLLDLYRRLLEALARRGLRRPAHLTPLEFARELGARRDVSAAVRELTGLFCRARYGGHAPTAAELARAEALLAALRRAPVAREPAANA